MGSGCLTCLDFCQLSATSSSMLDAHDTIGTQCTLLVRASPVLITLLPSTGPAYCQAHSSYRWKAAVLDPGCTSTRHGQWAFDMLGLVPVVSCGNQAQHVRCRLHHRDIMQPRHYNTLRPHACTHARGKPQKCSRPPPPHHHHEAHAHTTSTYPPSPPEKVTPSPSPM